MKTGNPTLQRKLDLLLRTGSLLMESVADTSHIMRNMKRTAAYLGLPEDNLHLYVNYNIAVGVAIPNIFFRRMINLQRERKLLRLLILRRRKNGKFVELGEL